MSDLELIKMYVENLQNDLREDKIDLHFARVEAKSILTKTLMLLEKTKETDEIYQELTSILVDIKKLIDSISHNIEIQNKLENFKNNF